MHRRNLAGTVTLFRLFLWRDRFVLPLWVLLPPLIIQGQAMFVRALPDWNAFLQELTANPLTGAWLGPIVPLSIEGAIIWRGAVQAALLLILGSLFTVIRHTRGEEEAGCTELLRGGPVGRHAALTAALGLVSIANLVSGLLIALVLIAGALPAKGALLLGLTVAASGWLFSALAATTAQIGQHAGSARAIAFGALGLSLIPMVLNNVGRGYTGWAWLAPLAWYRLTQPFSGDHGWVLLLLVVLSLLVMVLAYILALHRDLGAGMLPSRSRSAEAVPVLKNPLALAWRLHRFSFVLWAVGLALIGGALGAIVPNISTNLTEMLTDLWPDRWVSLVETVGTREAFVSVSLYILAIGVTIYGISTVLQLRKEEEEHLASVLLSLPVTRTEWMRSYLSVAFAGSALLLLLLGLATGMTWGLATDTVSAVLPQALGLSLSKTPAVWVAIGITALLYGGLPRAVKATSWAVLTLWVIVEVLWEAQVVDWQTMYISPFSWAHYTTPLFALSPVPLIALSGLALLLSAAGLLGFRRRDVG